MSLDKEYILSGHLGNIHREQNILYFSIYFYVRLAILLAEYQICQLEFSGIKMQMNCYKNDILR
jgi:hypothetical protein